MILLLASPDAFILKDKHRQALADVLSKAKAAGNEVALLSNNEKPDWFDDLFQGTGVEFHKVVGRQDGSIIPLVTKQMDVEPYDAIVLAANREDIMMGKNGNAVVVAANWSKDHQVKALGIQAKHGDDLSQIIQLTGSWEGDWWYSGSAAGYEVRVLGDLSTYYKPADQEIFATQLKATVKHGGPKLNALLALTARSALIEGLGKLDDTLWGVFPSSSSDNKDAEVLSDFCHRLRTTVSKVRFCKKGQPLFIRHIASRKRSGGGVSDRENPAEQLETLHVNPYYASQRLTGRNVVLVDDCMTCGTSFGVAAALLRAAGASTVTCIALGKFGNQDKSYDITITGDPAAPLSSTDYTVNDISMMKSIRSGDVQRSLVQLLK